MPLSRLLLTYQCSEEDLKGLEVGYILLTKVTTSKIAKRTVLAPNPLEGIELKPISLSLVVVLCQDLTRDRQSWYHWSHLSE